MTGGLFGGRHIVFLTITIIIAVCAAIYVAKKHGWNDKVVLICACALAVGEIVRLFALMEARGTKGAYYLRPDALPFHLCTLQMFLMFILYFSKKEKTKYFLYSFMYPTCLCGATMAILLPGEDIVVSFDNIFGVQSMYSHGILLAFGLYMFLTKPIKYGAKSYGLAMAGLGIGLIGAIYIDSILGAYYNPDADINFFFISYFPVEGLPLFNTDNGWYAYITAMSTLSVVLMSLAYIPVVVTWLKNRNRGVDDGFGQVALDK